MGYKKRETSRTASAHAGLRTIKGRSFDTCLRANETPGSTTAPTPEERAKPPRTMWRIREPEGTNTQRIKFTHWEDPEESTRIWQHLCRYKLLLHGFVLNAR